MSTHTCGQLIIEDGERRVWVDEKLIDLSPLEFDLLTTMVSRPGYVWSKTELLHSVWKSKEDWQAASTVTEHIRRLRTKLKLNDEHSPWIQTARGRGYRYERRSRARWEP